MCLHLKIVESCSAGGQMVCPGETFAWEGLGDRMKL